MLSRVVFSQKSNHWATPPEVYDPLHAEFGFTFDPCPLMASEDGGERQHEGDDHHRRWYDKKLEEQK